MINGVLVERTVGDVLPQLQSNSDNMNKVLVELAKQYKTKQDDMEKWKVSQSSSSMLVNQSREKRELVANDSFNLQKKNKIQVVQQ
jgi:multidrug efflux pump subunit AcrB